MARCYIPIKSSLDIIDCLGGGASREDWEHFGEQHAAVAAMVQDVLDDPEFWERDEDGAP